MKLYLGEQLKKLRKEKQITQEQLAEVLGVSYQSVSRWELGACYPDMELVPSIANYFGVTIDQLFANDDAAKEEDRQRFYEQLKVLDGMEKVRLAEEYSRKYPDDDRYAFVLMNVLTEHVINNDAERAKYLPKMTALTYRLKDTMYRMCTLQNMIAVCDDVDLNGWLNQCPWSSEGSRRSLLTERYSMRGDREKQCIQQGIAAFEDFATRLDNRYPDEFGAEKKAEYHREVLRILTSFGDGTTPPDGWACYYAYKQLVLAASLFGDGKEEEGWCEFDAAMATYRRVFESKQEWFDLGGLFFANLQIHRGYEKVKDTTGAIHDLYGSHFVDFAMPSYLYRCLSNPYWAWFDSVRDTEKYQAAAQWAKEMAEQA